MLFGGEMLEGGWASVGAVVVCLVTWTAGWKISTWTIGRRVEWTRVSIWICTLLLVPIGVIGIIQGKGPWVNFSSLGKIDFWVKAMSQAILQTGVCRGVILFLASHRQARTEIIIPANWMALGIIGMSGVLCLATIGSGLVQVDLVIPLTN